MSSPTPTRSKFECHARRHMSATLYMTYDAILAMAKSGQYTPDAPLVFYGRISTVANHTGRSRQTESDNMSRLVSMRWLLPLDDKQPQQEDSGRWRPHMYRVVEHELYVKAMKLAGKASCKPFQYDPETGERVGEPGVLLPGLKKYRDEYRKSQPCQEVLSASV
jgi:hypothetical protein